MRAWWVAAAILVPALAPLAAADASPPAVVRFAFDRNEYVAGTNVQAHVTVHDPEGVEAVSYLLEEPGGRLHPSTSCGRVSGNATHPRYVCQTTMPYDAPRGTYAVHSVNVTDGDGNHTRLTAGGDGLKPGPNVTLQVRILTFVDTEPPELESVVLSSTALPRGGTLRIDVGADDPSGLAEARLVFDGPEDGTPLETSCAGVREQASCVLQIPRSAAVGAYYLQKVELEDGRDQRTTLFRDVDFRPGPTMQVTFNVTLGFNDTAKPVLQAYRMPAEPVRRGETVTVELDAADNLAVTGGEMHFESMHGRVRLELRDCDGFGNRTVKARCSAVVPDTHPLGRSRLTTVVLRDGSGNEHRQAVVAPSPEVSTYAALLRQMTFTVLPGTLRTTGGAGEGLVAGLLPAVPEVAPGRVLPIVVAEGVPLQNVSFRFTGPGGTTVLGVQDCSAGKHPLPGGMECHLLVPPQAVRGEYRLTKLRALPRGEDWEPVDVDLPFAPRLHVTDAAATPLERLPVGFSSLVLEGVTQAEVNTVPPPEPTQEPLNTVTPPRRGTPLPFAVSLLALAAVLLRRRGTTPF